MTTTSTDRHGPPPAADTATARAAHAAGRHAQGAGLRSPPPSATARRTVLQFFRTPQVLIMGTVQGALFLFMFRYVFGGAIDTGGALELRRTSSSPASSSRSSSGPAWAPPPGVAEDVVHRRATTGSGRCPSPAPA